VNTVDESCAAQEKEIISYRMKFLYTLLKQKPPAGTWVAIPIGI